MRDEVFNLAGKVETLDANLTQAINVFGSFENGMCSLRQSMARCSKEASDSLLSQFVKSLDCVMSSFDLAWEHIARQRDEAREIADALYDLVQPNKKNVLEAGTSEDAKTQPKG